MKRVTHLILTLLIHLTFLSILPAQEASFEVKVQYMDSDDLTWGVFARPATGFEEAKDIIIAVSYTHLTLPTICSV